MPAQSTPLQARRSSGPVSFGIRNSGLCLARVHAAMTLFTSFASTADEAEKQSQPVNQSTQTFDEHKGKPLDASRDAARIVREVN